jgi:hypothetical protein
VLHLQARLSDGQSQREDLLTGNPTLPRISELQRRKGVKLSVMLVWPGVFGSHNVPKEDDSSWPDLEVAVEEVMVGRLASGRGSA